MTVGECGLTTHNALVGQDRFGSAPKKKVAWPANASPVRWILAKFGREQIGRRLGPCSPQYIGVCLGLRNKHGLFGIDCGLHFNSPRLVLGGGFHHLRFGRRHGTGRK
jgi:hypothetical protein